MNAFIYRLSCLLLVLFLTINAYCQETIFPDNPNLHYQGRIDFKNADEAVFIWSGTSVKMRFKGTSLKMFMDDKTSTDSSRTNYYTIIIDNVIDSVLQVHPDNTIYELASSLDNIEHVVEVFKRTEASVGISTFKGFEIDGEILGHSYISSRKVEFVGDSWVCGYGNERSCADAVDCTGTGFHSYNEDNLDAFGAIVSRKLDAQYMCTAYSGRGLYRNAGGSVTGTLPQIYSRIYPDKSLPDYDFNCYVPDLVVVYLGINDFFDEAFGGEDLDSAGYVNSYIDFIDLMKGKYPEVAILMVYGGSVTDGWPNKKWLTRWRNYISAVYSNYKLEDKIFKIEMNHVSGPWGEDWHPAGSAHVKISDQLILKIGEIMNWSLANNQTDCAGVLGGDAKIDECDRCTEGSSDLGACGVVKSEQEITFPEMESKFSTDEPFQLKATSSSGLAINYSVVSGPARVKNNTISLTGEGGTVVIKACQFGNENYYPALGVVKSFNVEKKVSSTKKYSSQQNLKVYPNPLPCGTNLNIFYSDLAYDESYNMIIMNNLGQNIFRKEIKYGLGNYEISTCNFSKGIYHLKIHSKNKYDDLKIVVM